MKPESDGFLPPAGEIAPDPQPAFGRDVNRIPGDGREPRKIGDRDGSSALQVHDVSPSFRRTTARRIRIPGNINPPGLPAGPGQLPRKGCPLTGAQSGVDRASRAEIDQHRTLLDQQIQVSAHLVSQRPLDEVINEIYAGQGNLFDDLFGSYQSVSYIDVDLDNPSVSVEIPYLAAGRQRTSSMIPGQFPGAVGGISPEILGTYLHVKRELKRGGGVEFAVRLYPLKVGSQMKPENEKRDPTWFSADLAKAGYPLLTDEQAKGLVMDTFIPKASWAYAGDENITIYPFDVEKGKALLEEDGWTIGDADPVRSKDKAVLALKFYTTLQFIYDHLDFRGTGPRNSRRSWPFPNRRSPSPRATAT